MGEIAITVNKTVARLAKFVLPVLVVLCLVAVLVYLASGYNIQLLNPKGTIALQQRDLMFIAIGMMLLVVIPVFIMTFVISWKYRASNVKAKYDPEWDHSRAAETLWWAVPFAIIAVLAGITWVTSHSLDPYRPLASDVKPVRIQVVALQWKWLFLYPEQGIATVNHVQFPVNTPVSFQITSDAPMNSFWIPQLGGQIYAMSGMNTSLHLMASDTGTYNGSSANISGEGFAGMKFTATAQTPGEFERWVSTITRKNIPLSSDAYDHLSEPSKNVPPQYYSSYQPDLYDTIIMKYMGHGGMHGH